MNLFAWFLRRAWDFVPRDWVWYSEQSLERGIYEALRNAVIDLDNLKEKKRLDWERVRDLPNKGTER